MFNDPADTCICCKEITRLNGIIKHMRRPGKSNLPYIQEITRLRDDLTIMTRDYNSEHVEKNELQDEVARLRAEVAFEQDQGAAMNHDINRLTAALEAAPDEHEIEVKDVYRDWLGVRKQALERAE